MAQDTARRAYSFDSALQLKDAGLVAASAAATVASAAQVLDVGASFYAAVAVLDVSAIEIGTGNEKYVVIVQGSNSATFASGIENLAALDVGAASSGRYGSAQDSTAGRYEIPFFNANNDTVYRYIRIYTFVSGTIATGINYTAFVGKMPYAAH